MSPIRSVAALAAIVASAATAAAPAQPEFRQFTGGNEKKAELVDHDAAVPAPHRHVMRAITRADGSVELTCATERNERFTAFEHQRRGTQEK